MIPARIALYGSLDKEGDISVPCYHPLMALWYGSYNENGSKKLKIVDHGDPTKDYGVLEQTLIPCGHCIGCRLEYSRRWADRMVLELQTMKTAVFVTLTYNEEHIHVANVNELGEPTSYTLDKRDSQLFMKRLRWKFPGRRIRFYLCGEYGSKTDRPHMHVILFGLGLSDLGKLRYRGKTKSGCDYYDSSLISEVWTLGFNTVQDVSYKALAYVARYATKKLNGPAAIKYAEKNQIPEFALMSRKPGIGREYLDQHPDCLDNVSISLGDASGSQKIMLPKYYIDQLNNPGSEKFPNTLYNPERFVKIMEDRKKCANDRILAEWRQQDLEFPDYLALKEHERKQKAKLLHRLVEGAEL